MTYLGPNDFNAHSIQKNTLKPSKSLSGAESDISFDKVLADVAATYDIKIDVKNISAVNNSVSQGFDKFEAEEHLKNAEPEKYLRQKLQNKIAKSTIDGFSRNNSGLFYGSNTVG